MTVSERISLCRLLEKIEAQEAYCASIGVCDVSKFCVSELVKKNGDIEKKEKGA